MFLGLVNRMIFWELLKVFLLSLTGLTGLFLVAGLIQQAAQLGLSPAQVIRAIPLLVPNSLPYTIPATTLFASCVVYGRLSNDNEVVALKAAGVDVLSVVWPAVLLGTVTMLVTGGLYYSAIPRTQQQLHAQILQDPEEVLYNLLKRDRRFVAPTSPYSLYVRDVQGRRLIDVVVKRKSGVTKTAEGGAVVEYDYVARAREAWLRVDPESRKLIVDADRWVVANPNSTIEARDTRPVEIDLPDMFSDKQVKSRPTSMEWEALPGRRAELVAKRDEAAAKVDANRREQLSADPALANGARVQERHFVAQQREAERNVRAVDYQYHIRPALAVGCLCFAVIGCPVGIWFNRSDYLSTFVTCFLPTLVVYYPLLLSGGGLAMDGKVPMTVGVWAANAVVGTAAMILTFTLIKR